MFENMDPFTIIVAQQTIKDAITSHEPRVDVLDVTVTANDNNELFIQVVFQIKNTQTPSVFTTTFTRVR
jgi:phage baseplate assembly protein W